MICEYDLYEGTSNTQRYDPSETTFYGRVTIQHGEDDFRGTRKERRAHAAQERSKRPAKRRRW